MHDYMDKESGIHGNILPLMLASQGQLVPGSEVRCAFRYGCHYERPARDGSLAYVIDLYQRKVVVTGRAMSTAELDFPVADELVEVEGIVIRQGDDVAIWVSFSLPWSSQSGQRCHLVRTFPGSRVRCS